jgi:ribosomal protein S18 acetylase RimI-like enzyme
MHVFWVALLAAKVAVETASGRPSNAANVSCQGHYVGLMTVRAVTGPEDVYDLQRLASRLWPKGWHPGGLGWALSRGRLADEVVVFEGKHGVLGWAARNGVHEPGELLAQADPAHPEIADAIVDWLLATPLATTLSIDVYDGDTTLSSALRRAGFKPQPGAHVFGMFREAKGVQAPAPPGYAIRATRGEELDARVAVHRAAWRPAAQPWSDGRVVDPQAESSFNAAEYEAVRKTWLYAPEFDLVAVGPDKTFAGCCIAWFDPATGAAEVEPLGVAPEHRRAGLAVAMCLEVASRVSAAGGSSVFINTEPRPEYPAPSAAYAKAGFETIDRGTRYIRSEVGTRKPRGVSYPS